MGRSSSRERKKINQQVDIDRISELPESIIIQILSLLDMKDVVKTGVLAKRWKNTWTHVDNIVFHCDCDYHYEFMERTAQKFEQFMLFVDRTLIQCTSQKIKKFSVSGHGFYRDLSLPVKLVDKWLQFVLNKNVEVLELGLRGLDYDFPISIYRNSSLVSLEIYDVGKRYLHEDEFASLITLEADVDEPYYYKKKFDISWNVLKSLSLEHIYVKQECMVEILLACPMLETIVLDCISGLWTLNITSPSVTELKVLNFFSNSQDDYNLILKIIAPWIKKLEISGYFDYFYCNLVSVLSLKYANLTLSCCGRGHVNQDGVWSDMIDNLLKPVCHANELVIGAELLQALSMPTLLGWPSLMFKCKYLTVCSPVCVHEVPGIVCLLESSPFMETLVVRVMPWQCSLSTYDCEDYPEFIKNVFSSFEGVDYLSQQKKNFPCLNNVKIDCREKLYSHVEDQRSDNICFELEIAAHIIRNSPVLEKLVLLSSKFNSSECAAQYIFLLSSECMIGKKSARWELKKANSTYEFSFSS